MELNEYVNYRQMLNDLIKSHLDKYKTLDEYIENYLCECVEDIEESFIERLKSLYSLINDKEYLKSLEIDFECSAINTVDDELYITLADDRSTSTECGYEADFCLYMFKVDLDSECFSDLEIDK